MYLAGVAGVIVNHQPEVDFSATRGIGRHGCAPCWSARPAPSKHLVGLRSALHVVSRIYECVAEF
jgi:hypothetical protein